MFAVHPESYKRDFNRKGAGFAGREKYNAYTGTVTGQNLELDIPAFLPERTLPVVGPDETADALKPTGSSSSARQE